MGEVEPRLEVVPQELGLENSSVGPGELLSHIVKEESDTEAELGEDGAVWCSLGEILGLGLVGLSELKWCAAQIGVSLRGLPTG